MKLSGSSCRNLKIVLEATKWTILIWTMLYNVSSIHNKGSHYCPDSTNFTRCTHNPATNNIVYKSCQLKAIKADSNKHKLPQETINWIKTLKIKR